MPVFRYSVSNGLHGCYLPDNVSGPLVGSSRRELASIIREELRMLDWPASLFAEVRLRRLWGFIARHGSSQAHFSLVHNDYELAFHGLTEEEAEHMEKESA